MLSPCPQCGAPVTLAVEARFVDCRHCESTLVVDKDKLFFHYLLPPNLDLPHAEGSVRRWMSGDLTPRNLASQARFESSQKKMYPVWMITFDSDGRRFVRQTPARGDMPAELSSLMVPAGALEFYESESAAGFEALAHDISADSAQESMNRQLDLLAGKGQSLTIARAVLVHIPLFVLTYRYRNRTYHIFVDAAVGDVYPGRYPAKRELPFVITGLVCFWTMTVAGSLIPGHLFRVAALACLACALTVLAYFTASRV